MKAHAGALALALSAGLCSGIGCEGTVQHSAAVSTVADAGGPPADDVGLSEAAGRPLGQLQDSGDDDPDPVFDPGAMDQLHTLELAPDAAPPADCTNRWADDPKAAAFGQKLFFDKSFSGPLLDPDNMEVDNDNDGVLDTLGKRGEPGRVACAGCHVPQAGFSDVCSPGKQISLASGWVLRRTPSLLDVSWSPLLMWDGRRDAFYNQVFGVFENHKEGNTSRLFVALQVQRHHAAEYAEVFGAPPLAHPERLPSLTAERTGCRLSNRNQPEYCCGMPGDRDAVKPGDGLGCNEYDGLTPADQEAVTAVVVNVGKAMGAYMRTLSCGPGRFDGWLRGTEVLSRAEQRGAQLFVGKAQCIHCHSGPQLSDYGFHNVGLEPRTVANSFSDIDDHGASKGLSALQANEDGLGTETAKPRWSDCPVSPGRVPVAVADKMTGAFKTPSLRCLSLRPSFMHTGQMRTLEEVLTFFNKGGSHRGYPGTNELEPLGLSRREVADLIAFLHTLDGAGPAPSLLRDPRLPEDAAPRAPCAARLLP